MVSLYFGLPRSGKTTLLTAHALKYVRGFKYRHVYSNIPLNIPGVTYVKNDMIGKFQLEDGVLLIDEATLFADSRDYKNFSKDKISWFLLHGHYRVDVELYTQQWDGVDRKIRTITDKCYYLYKPKLRPGITKYYRIPFGIIIPDKRDSGEKLGDIVQGYCKPSVLERIFCHRLKRKKYYKYFDSWNAPHLLDLPQVYSLSVLSGESVSGSTL